VSAPWKLHTNTQTVGVTTTGSNRPSLLSWALERFSRKVADSDRDELARWAIRIDGEFAKRA
jgi:hypothetical protein